MAESNQQAEALLTEHFRYTPLSLIDEIINAVNTIIYRAIEAIETGLLSIPPSTLGFESSASSSGDVAMRDAGSKDEGEQAREEIEEGVYRLETLLEATVDKTFDKFEIYTLRNILTVPDELAPWMRLGHYENLPLPLPHTSPTPESILALRRTLHTQKSLNSALRRTHAQNSSLLTSLTSLLFPPPSSSSSTSPPNPEPASLAFLQPPANSQSHTLLTRAQFQTTNLPALRALLASLRPHLDSLRAGAVAGSASKEHEAGGESRREERRMYLEGRVRRVVGPGGEGEGVLGGTSIGGEEVEGLEGVVRRMAGGRG